MTVIELANYYMPYVSTAVFLVVLLSWASVPLRFWARVADAENEGWPIERASFYGLSAFLVMACWLLPGFIVWQIFN